MMSSGIHWLPILKPSANRHSHRKEDRIKRQGNSAEYEPCAGEGDRGLLHMWGLGEGQPAYCDQQGGATLELHTKMTLDYAWHGMGRLMMEPMMALGRPVYDGNACVITEERGWGSPGRWMGEARVIQGRMVRAIARVGSLGGWRARDHLDTGTPCLGMPCGGMWWPGWAAVMTCDGMGCTELHHAVPGYTRRCCGWPGCTLCAPSFW